MILLRPLVASDLREARRAACGTRGPCSLPGPGRARPVREATSVPSPRPPERKPENARSIMLQPDSGPPAPFGSAARARRISEGEGERSRERSFGGPGPVQGAGRRKRSRRPGISARVLFRADREEIPRPHDPGDGPGPGSDRCGHRRCGVVRTPGPGAKLIVPGPHPGPGMRTARPGARRSGTFFTRVAPEAAAEVVQVGGRLERGQLVVVLPACVLPVRGRPAVGAGTRRCRVGCRSSRHPAPLPG